MPALREDLGPLFTINVEELTRPSRRREDRDVWVLRVEIEAQRREVARLRSMLESGSTGGLAGRADIAPAKMLLTLKDLRAMLGVSRGTLYRWVDLGLFPKQIHLGSLSRWNRSEVEAWLATKRTGQFGPEGALVLRRGRSRRP